MSTRFEEFVDAVSARPTPQSPGGELSIDRVTVLGGGSDALLLSALCTAGGAKVTLFSAYGAELDSLRTGHGIVLSGSGPVGSYQVDRPDSPSILTTAELDRAVANAQLIFLTGPVHKQRTYAMVLADHLQDGQALVMAPGRSFGAAEAAWLLRAGGTQADCTLIEILNLPYWYGVQGNRFMLSPASGAPAAAIPAGRTNVLEALKQFIPNLVPVANAVQSSFNDGSGLIETPALLLGGPVLSSGLPKLPVGGVPLPENSTFRTLIGPEHKQLISQLADERRTVARKFGVRDLPEDSEWLDRHAGSPRGEGSRPIPNAREAFMVVRSAVVGSLVPLLSAARIAGQAVPATEAMVTIAGAILGADLQFAGRRLDMIGIDAGNIEDCRRLLDRMAEGKR